MMRLLPLLALLTVLLPVTAPAVEPNEMLEDPALEARARDIGKNLRCLVCQNQSIDDSNADLARDLRVLVRERLSAGDTDDQVLDFVVSRYGDFVLLNPPFKASTLLLWIGPAILLALAMMGSFLYYRSQKSAPATRSLSKEEQALAESLLKGNDS